MILLSIGKVITGFFKHVNPSQHMHPLSTDHSTRFAKSWKIIKFCLGKLHLGNLRLLKTHSVKIGAMSFSTNMLFTKALLPLKFSYHDLFPTKKVRARLGIEMWAYFKNYFIANLSFLGRVRHRSSLGQPC